MKPARGVDLGKDADVGQLADWHVLRGHCSACPHVGKLYWKHIRRQMPPTCKIEEIAKRFRCRQCGNRSGNLMTIEMIPRD